MEEQKRSLSVTSARFSQPLQKLESGVDLSHFRRLTFPQRLTRRVESSISIEEVFEKQTEKRKEALAIQEANCDRWEKRDVCFLGVRELLIGSNFVEGTEHHLANSTWEYCSKFHPGIIDQKPLFKTQWLQSETNFPKRCKSGLNLRLIAIRPKQKLALRSLAVEMKASFKLQGTSSIWIFSRVEGNSLSQSTAIVKLEKEGFSQNIVLTFGILSNSDEDSYDEFQTGLRFTFLKKQELPHIFAYNPTTDAISLNLVLLDNGDDTVAAKLFFNPSRVLRVYCKQFAPVLERCSIVIGGSGHAAYIRECTIKQVARVSDPFKGGVEDRKGCCCTVF